MYGVLKKAFVEQGPVGHLLSSVNMVWVELGGQSWDSILDVEQESSLNAFVPIWGEILKVVSTYSSLPELSAS